jgi:hypothetical protein
MDCYKGFFVSSKLSTFLAHVRQDDIGQWQPHLLDEHLRGVAVLTESISPLPVTWSVSPCQPPHGAIALR